MHRPCYDRTELKEVVDVISGYAFPGYEMGSSGSPIIKIKNIIPPMVDTTDVDRISEVFIASIPKLKKFRLKHKDILIAMTGATVGKIGRFPKANEIFYLNQRVARVDLRNPAQADIDYIYYVLSQTQYTDQIFSLADGSAQANVSASQIGNITMPLPPLPEQRRIAHILGTLDDNIENNRKTAKALEAMAQAIFKSWFVDFDPVRSKMNGESRESICKRLKITPEILDLFPDRLVDSELGEIPEGWEVGTIIDIATISSGKRPENRLERPSEDAHIPLWGGNGPIGFVTEPLIYESCILTGRVGTLGTFFRINTPCWPSDNTLIIRAIKNAYYEYVFFNISQIDMTLLNRGSTQPLLTQSDLSSQPIVIPSSDIIGSFHDVSYTLLQYANFFSLNYSYVVIARDTLLPKLISGEIRVPEAKYCVEAAMSGEV